MNENSCLEEFPWDDVWCIHKLIENIMQMTEETFGQRIQ